MATFTRNTTELTDLNLSFEINSNTGDFNKLSTSAVIRRSLENILTTGKMEKPFRESYGSDVSLRLFDVASNRDLASIESQIRNAIDRNEKRIKLNDLSLFGNFDNHQIEMTITYTIRKTSETDEITTMLALSD